MKTLLKLLVVLGVLVAIGVAISGPTARYWKERNRPKFRTTKVDRGDITFVVNSTGTIKPVLSVQVGAFVSGPIQRLHVDFNDEVKEGDLLAEIDPRIYEAAVARDRAALATRQAEVHRTEANLQRAHNDLNRAVGLRSDNVNFISDSEMDQYKFNKLALEAELVVAKATVEQAEANLNNSLANLNYTKITAPVDGIIIDRKIEPGQTLAAQFQTPELFIVAPDLREEMHVFASVDETDIGLIAKAKEQGEPVHFTVSSHPGELFEGTVAQIRLSSTTTQNVVTYPVVIAAPNPELKLLPGMTADISFQIEQKEEILRIPNSALRYFPQQRELVREKDRTLLDGVTTTERNGSTTEETSAKKKADSERSRRTRHVWVKDGDTLRAVEVTCGISDFKFTELIAGDLKEDDELVIGMKEN